jgi:hypothetical protein
MKEHLETALKDFEISHQLKYLSGQRDRLLSELNRSLDFVNGQWRTKQGSKVEIENVIRAKLETGSYVLSKPSVKDIYLTPFLKRSDQAKEDQQKFTADYVKRAIEKSNIHFQPGADSKAIEIIAQHFLPHDTDNGPAFTKINDTEIGTLIGSESYSLMDLINTTGLNEWLDVSKTKIATAKHQSQLHRTAIEMLPPNASNADVENMLSELTKFEQRALKVGFEVPFNNKGLAQQEFTKWFSLGGADRSKTTASVRGAIDRLDELDSIRQVVRETEIPTSAPSKFEGLTY